MRPLRLALLLPLLLSACGEDAPPPRSPVPTPPVTAAPVVTAPPPPAAKAPVAPVALEEYFKIRRVPAFSRSGLPLLSFSSDETKVAYATDETGRIDIWVKPVAGDAKAVQVSHVEGFVHSFAFSPKEDVLVFEADRGGDELPRLYATDSKGAPARELVPELPAGRRTQFVEWARNGATFLYLANNRDEKDLDLLEYDLKTKKSTLVWQGGGSVAFAATNVEHTRFALVDTHSDANSDVLVIDRNEKKPTLITQHTGDTKFEAAVFARDGKSLYVTSDEDGEFTLLYAAALPGGKRTKVLAEKWDVDAVDVSKTGKYLVTEVNENGVPKLVISEKGKPVALPPVPAKAGAWKAVSFSNSDRYFGVTLVSDTSPSSSYVIDLKSGTVTALTDPLPESLRGRTMVAGEAVEIPSFDGKKVPAFLYRPTGVVGPVPAIIDVHGGPTSQSRRTFAAFRQYAVSKGYAVLVPNVRGSTGYGKTYTRLDNLDLGGGPLKDIVACKRWLVTNASVAPDKAVVFGGSYGGYMALVAEAFTPDEFAANVDFFGVSDLKTLVESFPPYWASSASYIFQKFGDPKNPAHTTYQHDRSPIHFVGQMKRPLLVVQGDKDARVKKEQSDRIVQGLRDRKVPVHYLILENEGHGFTKTENNLRALKLTDRFLDRYVFGDTSITDLP